MFQYDSAHRFGVFLISCTPCERWTVFMDSQFILGCVISMKIVKCQSKRSRPKIFQQFGIEIAYTVISNSVFKWRNFGGSYCDKVEASFTLDVLLCRFSRYLNLFILGMLFKRTKLSLDIWALISRAIANESSSVLKRQLHQPPQSMALGV